MKKTYVIPAQRWAIMEEEFLISPSGPEVINYPGSVTPYAIQDCSMEAKEESNWNHNSGGNLWDVEW